MNGYPGSKGASGVSERIIRLQPPHGVYVEGFAGCAAVWRKKLAATSSVLIDVDAKLCHRLRSYIAGRDDAARCEVLHGDAMDLVPSLPAVRSSDTLVYFDAPYMRATRSNKLLYDCEFDTPEKHSALLAMAAALPCFVQISHYPCKLYEKTLKRWWYYEIPAMTRGGLRTEGLWCNFPEPKVLHDHRFAGKDYRERERIKRKRKRWLVKFQDMDARERQVIAAALAGVDRAAMAAALRIPPSEATVAAAIAGPGDAADREERNVS